jgi:hypothetical protein
LAYEEPLKFHPYQRETQYPFWGESEKDVPRTSYTWILAIMYLNSNERIDFLFLARGVFLSMYWEAVKYFSPF